VSNPTPLKDQLDLIEFQRLHVEFDGNLTDMAMAFYKLDCHDTESDRTNARMRFSRFNKRIKEISALESLAEKHAVSEDATITGGTIKSYQMGYKDGNDVGQAMDLESITVTYEQTHDTAAYPIIDRAHASQAPTIIVYSRIPQRRSNIKVVVGLPDTQFGYQRHLDTDFWEPMHDLQAIDVAYQIIADLQPRKLFHVGDLLDETEWSRWQQHPEFVRTTQRAINTGHDFLANCEAAHPKPQVLEDQTELTPGNHDRRGRDYLLKNAQALMNIRPAHLTGAPPYTLEWLLRTDELGIKVAPQYPSGEIWLTDDLIVRHNPENKQDYDASTIFGHTHKITRDTFSRRGRYGLKSYTNWGIGCLCRVDDRSDINALSRTYVASDQGFVKNWAQAVAVIYIDEDTGQYQVDQIQITKGRALYNGRRYVSAVSLESAEAVRAA